MLRGNLEQGVVGQLCAIHSVTSARSCESREIRRLSIRCTFSGRIVSLGCRSITASGIKAVAGVSVASRQAGFAAQKLLEQLEEQTLEERQGDMLMRVDKGNELKRKGGKNRQQGRYTGQESKFGDCEVKLTHLVPFVKDKSSY